MFLHRYNMFSNGLITSVDKLAEDVFTGDVLLVVGAENAGVSKEVLEAANEIVRLPMPLLFHHTTYRLQSVLLQ